MTREELKEIIDKNTVKSSKLAWQKSGYIYSPFISRFATVNKHEYNVSYYATYSLTSNSDIHYTVVLSFYNGKYILKCGDPYLEGAITDETATNLINNTLGKVNNGTNKHLPHLLKQSYSIAPRSSTCSFNQKK